MSLLNLKQHSKYEDIKNFLKETKYYPNSVANGTYAYYDSKHKINAVTSYICHNTFNPTESYYERDLLIATGIHTSPETKELADSFISWAFDPQKSPWRKIIQDKSNYEFVYGDDGVIRGVIFSPYVFASVNWKFIRNFCVALRFTQEYNNQLTAWKKILDEGIDPRDAYILVRSTIGPNLQHHIRYGGHNGSHWPLTGNKFSVNNQHYGFDWDKYWNGNIDQTVESNGHSFNGFFYSKNSDLILWERPYHSDWKAVLDSYFEWKKINNLENIEK